MATNKQRREAERRRLQQQLAERRAKEVSRRRFTLISSVVGTLAVIALIVIVIVAATSGDDKKTPSAKGPSSTTPTPTSASTSAAACQATLPAKTVRAAKGATVSFNGVSVKGATDLGGEPTVTSKGTTSPTKLEYKDLVVGKGTAAAATSCVDVQYVGIQYKNGKIFDSSWKRGAAAEFSLSGVVAGFTQGIGGTTGVPPMKVGGRRIMILPAALGYPQGNSQAGIAANTPLVFVVDLVKVS